MIFSKRAIALSIFFIAMVAVAPLWALTDGEPAPDFTLPSLAGEEITLSDFKGKVILLKLATTWCPTCKELSGEIKRVAKTLAEHDVVFLEVFVQDSEKMITNYLKGTEYPMTYHALLDDGQAYRAYNVYLIPRLLVIDAEQFVRFDSAGRNVAAEDILKLVAEVGQVENPS